MKPAPASPDRFARIGSNVAVDFANTTYDPHHAEGSLRTAQDVLDFLAATQTLSDREAADLRRALSERATAERFLAKALELRRAVAAALAAIEAHRPVPESALAILNGALRSGGGYEQLARRRGSYELAIQRNSPDRAAALAPLARSTALLLANPHSPVRKCANPECTRRFYDDSRSGRRRWCEMAVCGNRAKVTAFLERKRARTQPAGRP